MYLYAFWKACTKFFRLRIYEICTTCMTKEEERAVFALHSGLATSSSARCMLSFDDKEVAMQNCRRELNFVCLTISCERHYASVQQIAFLLLAPPPRMFSLFVQLYAKACDSQDEDACHGNGVDDDHTYRECREPEDVASGTCSTENVLSLPGHPVQVILGARTHTQTVPQCLSPTYHITRRERRKRRQIGVFCA